MLQQYKGLSTDTTSARKLKDQIEKVIKTPYIKTARDDLKIIRRELLQKIGDGTDDRQLQLLYNGLKELGEHEEKYESTSTELTEAIASEKETLKGIDSDLASHSAMMETMRDLESIDNKVTHIKSELDNTKEILKSQGSNAWTYLASCFIESKKIEVLRRLKKRDNFNLDLLNKFKKMQLPLSYKKKKSHFIIKNNFTKKDVNKDIKNIIKKIYK